MNRKTIRPVLDGRFELLADNETHRVALGNATAFTVLLHMCPQTAQLYVGVVGKGCYMFAHNSYLHKNYVADKLGLCPADGANMADFINSQLNITWESWDPQGEYTDVYMDTGSVGSKVDLIGEPNEWAFVITGYEKPETGMGLTTLITSVSNPDDKRKVDREELVVTK